MKKSTVVLSLFEQADIALTGYPDSKGYCLNTYQDSFSSLLTLRSLSASIFGPFSPEYEKMCIYFDSLRGLAFVGPLPLSSGVSNVF